jgi:Uma2 family endonuclease
MSVRNPTLTEAEYLRLEEHSPQKHMFVNGQVLAMAGASPFHNALANNVAFVLTGLTRPRGCTVFNSDQRLKVESFYVYPDVTLASGPKRFSTSGRPASLINPTLLVEVLSTSTQGHDRTFKWQHYRRIPSLRAYMMVVPWSRSVELYFRPEEQDMWSYRVFEGLDATVHVPPLELAFPLRDLFVGTEGLEEEPAPPTPPGVLFE